MRNHHRFTSPVGLESVTPAYTTHGHEVPGSRIGEKFPIDGFDRAANERRENDRARVSNRQLELMTRQTRADGLIITVAPHAAGRGNKCECNTEVSFKTTHLFRN